MDIARYIVGGSLALLGAVIVFSTYVAVLRKRAGDGGYSLIPLIGPLAFIGGVAISPISFSHWLWLVFLIDINTIAIPATVAAMFSASSFKKR